MSLLYLQYSPPHLTGGGACICVSSVSFCILPAACWLLEHVSAVVLVLHRHTASQLQLLKLPISPIYPRLQSTTNQPFLTFVSSCISAMPPQARGLSNRDPGPGYSRVRACRWRFRSMTLDDVGRYLVDRMLVMKRP